MAYNNISSTETRCSLMSYTPSKIIRVSHKADIDADKASISLALADGSHIDLKGSFSYRISGNEKSLSSVASLLSHSHLTAVKQFKTINPNVVGVTFSIRAYGIFPRNVSFWWLLDSDKTDLTINDETVSLHHLPNYEFRTKTRKANA